MKKFLIITVLVLTGVFTAWQLNISYAAQTDDERIADLRHQIEILEQQASLYRTNIASEREKADTLNREISILQNEIKGLETQISLTSKKIDKTKIEISNTEGRIGQILEDIHTKKETMTRLLLFVNQYDQENLLATLVKNQDLSDFFRQGQYVSSVNRQLLSLVDELQDAKNELEGNKHDLVQKEDELEDLNTQQQQKKNSLSSVKQNKNTVLKQTKGQEVAYQKMLTETENKKAAFFQELQQLENNVIIGGNFIVHVTATSVPPKGTKLFNWPEDHYRITQGYGMTTYAKRGAYGGAPHNGVDVSGGFGTEIHAIGDGTVIANGYNDGFGNWVAVQHPPYNLVSIYGHMSTVAARVGTQVKGGQTIIGYEGSTGNSTGSHVHVSLYKDFFTYVKSGNNQLYFNYFEGSVNPDDYI
ncbi:MAG: peptidoglycan DD-metalloendopeptidase family protein [Candidatus Yanofskybacteria bacterium]|nr:peptidoglycan DD-metalloendopeptidase family protein [Candidatus Yanofskybacteria bacterium]